MTEIVNAVDNPKPTQTTPEPRSSVSVWRRSGGPPNWSVKVLEDTSEQEVSRLVAMALEADVALERALEGRTG